MAWEVVVTERCGDWLEGLDDDEFESVGAVINLLEEYGANLKRPYSGEIRGSRHGHMRELVIQHKGRPYRILYAFDPNRNAVLLVGGDKTGDKRWYEVFIPIAEAEYDNYLLETTKGGP